MKAESLSAALLPGRCQRAVRFTRVAPGGAHRSAALFGLFLLTPLLTMGQQAIMQWDFETITNRTCIEPATGVADTIEGNFEVVPVKITIAP